MAKTPPIPISNTKNNRRSMANCKKTSSKTSLQTTLRNNRTKEPKKLRGSNFYRTMGKDPITTKAFMRHKRLDTTQK
ncbi:MAG: hypothetical protein IAX22_10290 [Candidatus Bathyarchaeota archaeon]|nr:hypothetical protein [Candidatus Bathyarchaeota archaeon]